MNPTDARKLDFEAQGWQFREARLTDEYGFYANDGETLGWAVAAHNGKRFILYTASSRKQAYDRVFSVLDAARIAVGAMALTNHIEPLVTVIAAENHLLAAEGGD